jgi:excisionase family DNA binding protein
MNTNNLPSAAYPAYPNFNFSLERLPRTEAAVYLGVSPQFLEGDVVSNRHKIPYIKIGRKVYYLKSDLDAWIKSRKVEA